MSEFTFRYTNLQGDECAASFDQLVVVAEGQVPLSEPGWVGDRVNYFRASKVLIEFQSGSEGPPGFVPSRAVEVTASYVLAAYKIGEHQLVELCSPNKRFKPTRHKKPWRSA